MDWQERSSTATGEFQEASLGAHTCSPDGPKREEPAPRASTVVDERFSLRRRDWIAHDSIAQGQDSQAVVEARHRKAARAVGGPFGCLRGLG